MGKLYQPKVLLYIKIHPSSEDGVLKGRKSSQLGFDILIMRESSTNKLTNIWIDEFFVAKVKNLLYRFNLKTGYQITYTFFNRLTQHPHKSKATLRVLEILFKFIRIHSCRII